ncbi:MAG: hypothetical protein ACTTJ1_06970 [Treponema sp.]
MKEKAKISWTLYEDDEKFTASIKINGGGMDVIKGFKALLKAYAVQLSNESGMKENVVQKLIWEAINEEENNE